MLISHNFFPRLACIRGYQCPTEKDSVTDDVFKSIVCVTGNHQALLDISRCYKLSPPIFNHLERCASLQYLDLSYTPIRDLMPIKSCKSLRALNICGLRLSSDISFDALQDLTSLEILLLRSSNISKGARLKELIMLRSLDIGNTKIDSIEFVSTLRRLEEFFMDNIPLFARASHIKHCISVLQELSSLRLLNVNGTVLDQHYEELSLIDPDISIEDVSKR